MLNCSYLFKRDYFKSYSEFYLMCAIARVCLEKGISLDISGMSIEKDTVPEEILDYFKMLVYNKAIVGIDYDSSKKPSMDEKSKIYMDVHPFCTLDNLYRDDGDKCYWSFEYARDNYKGYRVNISEGGNFLIHLVANYIVSVATGELPSKKLVISITDGQKVKNSRFYINLISCHKTMKLFSDLIELDIDLSEYKFDLDYSLFCNNGYAAKRIKRWTIQEKKAFMEKENIVEGGIYVLWSRKGMCESNPIGRIESCTLVRLDEISDDCIYVTNLPLVKTQEEITDDYYDIPENKRHLFSDLLDFRLNVTTNTIQLYSMGVRNYFYDEYQFIDLLDSDGVVSKKITIDGNTDYVEMNEVNAIYWLLCQFEVQFDASLFKKIYSPNNDLLWDMYHDVL